MVGHELKFKGKSVKPQRKIQNGFRFWVLLASLKLPPSLKLRRDKATSQDGRQAEWRKEISNIEPRLILLGQARNVEIRREGFLGRLAGTFCPALIIAYFLRKLCRFEDIDSIKALCFNIM